MFHQLLLRTSAIASVIVDQNHYGNNLKYQVRMTNKVAQLVDEMMEIAGVDGTVEVKKYSERTTWVKLNQLLDDAQEAQDDEIEAILMTASALVNSIR